MAKPTDDNQFPAVSWSGSPDRGEDAEKLPQVKGYEIVKRLGEGGMGIVYLAEQKEPIKRTVALKVIKPGMDSAKVIARFEAERQALAVLDHPNIARVFDAGTTELDRPYFAMEYVEGKPITEYCDEHRLTIEDRLKLFMQVCEAIQFAHQKGIIHRDIKPSNILVNRIGNQVLPKIIDFGVAKAVNQPLTEQTLFTEQGQLIGTPEYMSPEQAGMTQEHVDTRSDVYSLGVLLYELLTGRLPFDHETFRDAAFVEVLRIIQEQDPPRPSARLSSLGEESKAVAEKRRTKVVTLVKRLHNELEWIPLKATRKDPDHRYRTASDLADDIHNYLQGSPLIAGPESRVYRARKFVRRNRVMVASGLSIITILTLAFFVSTAMYFRTKRAKEVADEEGETLRRALYFNRVSLAETKYQQGHIRNARQLLQACPRDLRHWEWNYLWDIINEETLILAENYRNRNRHAVFSREGTHVVVVADGPVEPSITLWDSKSGKKEQTVAIDLPQGGPFPQGLFPQSVLSPDNRRLAAVDWYTIVVWDTQSGKEIMRFVAHQDLITKLAFSPDGKVLASSGDDGRVKLWSMESPKKLGAFYGHYGHDEGVSVLTFGPDGGRVAIAWGREISILDTTTKVELCAFDKQESPIRCAAFDPSGKYLAAGSDGGTITVWYAQTGTKFATLKGHTGSVACIAFSPNGSRIASGGADRTVRLWDTDTRKEINIFTGHNRTPGYVSFSPDGGRLLTGSSEAIRLWDVKREPNPRVLPTHGTVNCLAYSPDGSKLAVGTTGHGTILVWPTGSTEDEPVAFGYGVSGSDTTKYISFCLDNNHILSVDQCYPHNSSYEREINLWNVRSAAKVKVLWDSYSEPPYPSGPDPIATVLNPDGTRLLIAMPKFLRMLDCKSGKEIRRFTFEDSILYFACAWSPDGKYLISGNHRAEKPRLFNLKIWDAASGIELMTIEGQGFFRTITVHPDNTIMATTYAHRDYDTVTLWDLSTGKILSVLHGHDAAVTSVAFSPDGKRIVTASRDETVKLWDMDSKAEILTLRNRNRNVLYSSVVFSPDGGSIAAGCVYGVKTWRAPKSNGLDGS